MYRSAVYCRLRIYLEIQAHVSLALCPNCPWCMCCYMWLPIAFRDNQQISLADSICGSWQKHSSCLQSLWHTIFYCLRHMAQISRKWLNSYSTLLWETCKDHQLNVPDNYLWSKGKLAKTFGLGWENGWPSYFCQFSLKNSWCCRVTPEMGTNGCLPY